MPPPPPPPSSSSAADATATPQFRGDVDADVRGVRRRLAAIVEQVCGGSPRAQDVTDRFGIYRKLGWQIWNVVYADEPLAAIRHLPAPRALKVFRDAARRQGVGDELLQRLDDAVGQFHRSVETHADNDREMLEMLVENGSEAPDEAAAARWRKQAFTGNAFTWGVRAKCMFACAVIFPSPTRDGYWDMVRIQGLIGLVRTRANVRWPFAQLLIRNSDGKPFQFAREPLDFSQAVKRTGVPLYEEFCSNPLPDVLRKPGAMAGMVEDELQPGEVGAAGAANIFTAERLREVAPIWAEKPGETVSFGTGVRTPCELFISDLIVRRSMYPGVKRELCVFGELMTQLSRDDRDRLPVPESVQSLGPVRDGIATADVPRHTELLHAAFDRAGLNADEFDAYRVRMRYPPLPVSVLVRHEMPMRPPPGQQTK
jgi:hypothetical protein